GADGWGKGALGDRGGHPLGAGPAHARARGGLAEQSPNRLQHGIGIRGIDHEPGDAVLDPLGRRADAADARPAGPHRLEEHETESLVATRHREERALAVERAQILLRDAAGEAHAPAERTSARLEPGAIVAVASHHEPGARDLL